MRFYGIKYRDSWDSIFKKIYYNALHALLLGLHNPMFGHEFRDVCIDASRKSKVFLEYTKSK